MKTLIPASMLALGLAAAAHAAPVNGTGDITPDIIFGDDNANGSFTGQTANNIEVGLRAKQRFPAANIFNYDGVDTYTFDSTVLTTNPTNRSVFNFEFSINVDQDDLSGSTLSDFSYALSVDQDPGILTNFVTVDPFNTFGFFDHALGTNATANGGGISSSDNPDLITNMTIYSVAQNSQNLGFNWALDPDAPGTYDFRLQVFAFSTSDVLAESSMRVIVSPVPPPVPVPAALPLLASALALVGFMTRRRRAA
jgi:hypothetical protein